MLLLALTYATVILSLLPFPVSTSNSSAEEPVPQARDDTMKDFKKEQDITEAVIRRILRSEIFEEDFDFMVRIALVESYFGTDNKTFRAKFDGGIWQVDEYKFKLTQNVQNSTLRPILQEYHAAIKSEFNITWTQVKWKDLLKPFYSGLSARLYLAILTDTADPEDFRKAYIPVTINRQAYFYSTYYRPEKEGGEGRKFQQVAHIHRRETERCRTKLDLVIALDGSGSTRMPRFNLLKDGVATFIESTFADASLRFTRIGIFVFSNKPYFLLDIENEEIEVGYITEAIKLAAFPGGESRVDKALIYGTQMLQNATKYFEGVPKVILLFTDGHSNVSLKEAVAFVEKNDVKTIVVGLGDDVDKQELLEIALKNERNAFDISGYRSALIHFLPRLGSIMCTLPQGLVVVGKNYTDWLGKNETRYYQVELATKNGVTLFITIQDGNSSVGVYWSYKDEVPYYRVRDGEMDGDGMTFVPPRNGTSIFPQTFFVSVQGYNETNIYLMYIKEGDHDTTNSGPATGKIHGFYGVFTVIVSLHLLFS